MNEFTSVEFMADPQALLRKLRREGPLVRRRLPLIGKVWITTTQAAAAEILKNHEVFTQRKANGKAIGLQWWMPRSFKLLAGNMLTMDEPDHTRLRNIVDQAFHRENILNMEPSLRAIAEELADDLFKQGKRADLLKLYARIFPLAVICELLGLPESDREKFMHWAGGITNVTGLLSFALIIPRISRMAKYLAGRIEDARRGDGDGLIAQLVRSEASGADLTSDELLAMVFLLLIAGHETTTHLISGGALSLLQNPDQKDWLQEDWSRIDLAVEEFLRHTSAVSFTKPRNARRDIEVEGVKIAKGDLVMPMLIAANYDPFVIDDPDRLELSRKPNRHMSFGTGIHFCLGHQLARLEAKIALKTLFTKYPKLQLAEDQVHWRRRLGLRAVAKLEVIVS